MQFYSKIAQLLKAKSCISDFYFRIGPLKSMFKYKQVKLINASQLNIDYYYLMTI